MRADLAEGCILKFRERHQRRPRQRLPLLFSSAARQTETLPSKYLFDARLERRDGALYVVSWSCRRAGAGAVTCLTWRPNKIYSSCVTRRAPDLGPLLLPLPRWLTQPDTYCPPRFIIINTPTIRGMFFLFCFFQTNPKKLFPKRWHKLAFGWDENLLIVKHIQGSFPECLAQRVGREAAAHIHFPHLHLQTVCCVVWPELFLGTKTKQKKNTHFFCLEWELWQRPGHSKVGTWWSSGSYTDKCFPSANVVRALTTLANHLYTIHLPYNNIDEDY